MLGKAGGCLEKLGEISYFLKEISFLIQGKKNSEVKTIADTSNHNRLNIYHERYMQ